MCSGSHIKRLEWLAKRARGDRNEFFHALNSPLGGADKKQSTWI